MRPTLRVRAGSVRLAGFFRLRRVLAALAVLGLGGAGLAAAAATPASAATSCQVAYSANSWSTGFTASITITNEGSALTSWTLAYTYSGNQQLAQGWSGNWSQSGETVTVTNASWNGSLATGASTSIGANFSYSGTNTAPTAFTINGTACTGAGGSPSPSPSTTPTSSPTPTGTPTPTGIAHPVAVTDFDGRRLLRVRRQPARQPGLVLRGPGHQRGVRRLAVRRPGGRHHGQRGRCRQHRPVRVERRAILPSRLTSSNWNLPQPVTVAANSSGTGAATFTVSAPGCTSVTVTGTETAAGFHDRRVTARGQPLHRLELVRQPQPAHLGLEVATSSAGASGTLAAQMTLVGQQSTGIWLDHIGAIYGGTANSNRMSLQQQPGHGGHRRVRQLRRSSSRW